MTWFFLSISSFVGRQNLNEKVKFLYLFRKVKHFIGFVVVNLTIFTCSRFLFNARHSPGYRDE